MLVVVLVVILALISIAFVMAPGSGLIADEKAIARYLGSGMKSSFSSKIKVSFRLAIQTRVMVDSQSYQAGC